MCSGRLTKGLAVQYIGRTGPRSGADDAIGLPGRLLEEEKRPGGRVSGEMQKFCRWPLKKNTRLNFEKGSYSSCSTGGSNGDPETTLMVRKTEILLGLRISYLPPN